MANNGVTKAGKVIGICVGVTVLLGFIGTVVGYAVDTRSTTRRNQTKIATLEKKVDYLYKQAVYDSIKESIENPELQKQIHEIIKENGNDST